MTTEDKFLAAVEIINSLPSDGPFQPSDDLMLKFYAYHKQATEGPCTTPKPLFWEVTSRNRWNAWSDLGIMTKEDAMKKYIEELAKVIETMSYNEKVSKFITLMGPFYEVVWADENDSQQTEENKKNLKNYTKGEDKTDSIPRTHFENFSVSTSVPKPTTGFDATSPKQYDAMQISESFSFGLDISSRNKTIPGNSSNMLFQDICSSRSSDTHSKSHRMTESDVREIFRKKRIPKNLPVSSPKDLLVLTVMNLQHSLEDIVKHLERLENLAKIANSENQKAKFENLGPAAWGLTFPSTAFILLWPIAVHLCMHCI